MPTLADRFEAKVNRSGEHHLWTGARFADGPGLIKANGKPTTARRVAWELTHGPMPPGARVLGCPADPACVRIDHLSLKGGNDRRAAAGQNAGAAGVGHEAPGPSRCLEADRDGGPLGYGSPRRVHGTARAATEAEASAALADFAAEVCAERAFARRQARPGDHRGRCSGAFLTEHLVGEKGREQRTVDDYRSSTPSGSRRRWRLAAANVDEATMDRLFGRMARAGLSRVSDEPGQSLYRTCSGGRGRRRLSSAAPWPTFESPTAASASRAGASGGRGARACSSGRRGGRARCRARAGTSGRSPGCGAASWRGCGARGCTRRPERSWSTPP